MVTVSQKKKHELVKAKWLVAVQMKNKDTSILACEYY
jgi:hypothetical protein